MHHVLALLEALIAAAVCPEAMSPVTRLAYTMATMPVGRQHRSVVRMAGTMYVGTGAAEAAARGGATGAATRGGGGANGASRCCGSAPEEPVEPTSAVTTARTSTVAEPPALRTVIRPSYSPSCEVSTRTS